MQPFSLHGGNDGFLRTENIMKKSLAPIDAKDVALIDEGLLKSKIYTIRGVKVMLDADLAEIYGYETRFFNLQVKNNLEKFDEDFRFQLREGEFKRLMLKNSTSKQGRGGTRKLPYAFTEQGVYMLMTVLKGDVATQQSKALIRLFKKDEGLHCGRKSTSFGVF